MAKPVNELTPMQRQYHEIKSRNRDCILFFRLGDFYEMCCCSVVKLCLTLYDPMDCSTPGFLVLHYLPEFAQIRVH